MIVSYWTLPGQPARRLDQAPVGQALQGAHGDPISRCRSSWFGRWRGPDPRHAAARLLVVLQQELRVDRLEAQPAADVLVVLLRRAGAAPRPPAGPSGSARSSPRRRPPARPPCGSSTSVPSCGTDSSPSLAQHRQHRRVVEQPVGVHVQDVEHPERRPPAARTCSSGCPARSPRPGSPGRTRAARGPPGASPPASAPWRPGRGRSTRRPRPSRGSGCRCRTRPGGGRR